MLTRLEAGGIVEDVVVDGDLSLSVRFEKCPAGWQASFSLTHPAADDIAIVHRLVAPSLAEARSSVPPAVIYLLGTPVDDATIAD
ncbi:MAG TPA: hypothetical protein VHW92_05000 [Mycobacteriales bacterium]|nr:hypothetical protein [Mycobacteriales bacterium]